MVKQIIASFLFHLSLIWTAQRITELRMILFIVMLFSFPFFTIAAEASSAPKISYIANALAKPIRILILTDRNAGRLKIGEYIIIQALSTHPTRYRWIRYIASENGIFTADLHSPDRQDPFDLHNLASNHAASVYDSEEKASLNRTLLRIRPIKMQMNDTVLA